MNILQVINSLDCGGLEKLTLDLVKKLKTRGHVVTICCLNGSGSLTDYYTDIEVASLNKKNGLDVTLPIRLAHIMQQKKVSIVHTHNPGPLLYGTLAAKLARIPGIINTRHGRAPKHMNRFVWNMNNSIVAISEDAKKELLRNNAIAPKKVSVIHNGIDLENFGKVINPLEEKKRLGLESSYVIGTVSRLSEEKDQASLIKAFAIVAATEPKAKFIFVGDGPLKGELEALTKELGLQDKIIFLGFRSDISVIVKAFDIFVLSSLQEGISLSLLEAMATSRPVVATNVGGNPEVVVDGKTGFLVPPKDPQKLAGAIIKLIKNPELTKKMGEAGRKRVEEKFSLDRMVREYEALYKTCLARKT